MQRREMIKATVATATLAATGPLFAQDTTTSGIVAATEKTAKFKLAYAPHPGMFKASAGDDVIDQIRFASDQGFTALEYNGLPNETPQLQEQIGQTLRDLDMQMGVFVAYGRFDRPTFAKPD